MRRAIHLAVPASTAAADPCTFYLCDAAPRPIACDGDAAARAAHSAGVSFAYRLPGDVADLLSYDDATAAWYDRGATGGVTHAIARDLAAASESGLGCAARDVVCYRALIGAELTAVEWGADVGFARSRALANLARERATSTTSRSPLGDVLARGARLTLFAAAHLNETAVRRSVAATAHHLFDTGHARLAGWLDEVRGHPDLGPSSSDWSAGYFDRLAPVAAGLSCATAGHDRFGGGGDGGKHICCTQPLGVDGCVAVSVGSAGEWDYERDIVRRTRCRVVTFDCGADYEVPADLSSRVRFVRQCLGASTDPARRMLTYADAMAAAGIPPGESPTHLKMDIEGHEYAVLEDAFSDGAGALPDQIALELHLATGFEARYVMSKGGVRYDGTLARPGARAIKSPGEVALFAQRLFAAGYLVASRRDHVVCAHCSELSLVRVLE